MTSVDLLDWVKARYNLSSDYQLAKKLHLTQSAISIHRIKPHGFTEKTALNIAKLLDLPPAYVLAMTHAERAKDAELAKIWNTLAERLEREIRLTKQRASNASERRAASRLV